MAEKKSDGDEAEAYYSMGDAYFQEEDCEKTIECYQKAIKLNPNFAEAYYSMGIVYCFDENYDKGIEYYQKAIELEPNFAEAYYEMSITYEIKGDYVKAIECCQKAIELKPNCADEYNARLRQYCMIKQNYDKAFENYKNKIEFSGDTLPF
uniref:Tetratricopeptide TPR_2 n=1 Tax=uncultured bacterium contig00046 TaxID=1181532 RepID=A0A806KFG9_9BACT|nr:tetratricopeptide TPR_2 [uncultured bacterium contig00046]